MKQKSIRNYRYGNLRREYLKAEYPREYQILLMTGQLSQHLTAIQKQAMSLRAQLEKTTEANNSTSSFLTKVQSLRQAEHTIEETVLAEVVYQPYITTV